MSRETQGATYGSADPEKVHQTATVRHFFHGSRLNYRVTSEGLFQRAEKAADERRINIHRT